MLVHPQAPRIRVVCVDDLADVTATMRMIIEMESDMECVGCLASADDLVKTARELQADILVLDATMPGKNPLAAIADLNRELPNLKTIVYSGHSDSAFIDRTMEAGAWGCVSKNDPPETIVQAVRAVAAGKIFFPMTQAAR